MNIQTLSCLQVVSRMFDFAADPPRAIGPACEPFGSQAEPVHVAAAEEPTCALPRRSKWFDCFAFGYPFVLPDSFCREQAPYRRHIRHRTHSLCDAD